METGIGGGLLVAGLGWFLAEGLSWNHVANERVELSRELAAGTLLGIGAGMFLAAGTIWLTHWAVGRKAKTAIRSRGAGALARGARKDIER
ncbi:hypothetical protein OV079_47400 [Nannocystis pusilla]|uniref:Uncharacterized protein n=1 Tax=Nannocystis pusilla TaxID=889268 RepID=A0A9X3EZM0_9BACT|nr:hypothetical protein [Nannocystis pusilla]MCY1013036.1 hypothetical protein [Nannocystis pusilla]